MGSMESISVPLAVLGSRISDAIRRAAARFMELAEQAVSQGLPTSPAQLLDLELMLHQKVSRECVDTVVGAVIVETHDSKE